MFSKKMLPVLAAVAGVASAASSDDDVCTQTTFTINSQADIAKLGSCSTLTGNVDVGTATDAILDFSPFKEIKGDLIVENNPIIKTLQSTSLTTITGDVQLQNLTALSTLSFTGLTEVGTLSLITLNALSDLTFTTGLQKASSIVISDTSLRDLDGIDVVSADTININNNRYLSSWTSSLGNLTNLITLNANGLNMEADFPDLLWVANMTISNVTKFSAPALKTVNGSLRFDSNFFTSFSAPNLTSTSSGDISFVSNADLTNITIPNLTSVGGGFLIANNTALSNITGFGKLKTVGGAINLRGNFTEIEFPSLDDVKGAFDVVSTSDISDSCATFKKLSPQSQGGGGQIQGSYKCQSNNVNANSDTSPTSTSTSSSSSPTASSDQGNAAAGLGVNSMAILGLAAVAVVFQML